MTATMIHDLFAHTIDRRIEEVAQFIAVCRSVKT